MDNRNPKKGWTRNWSGRGTALLDAMERESEKIRTVSTPTRRTVSVAEKLRRLLQKYPNRSFYQSLAWQMKKYPLSKKQIELIELDFWKYFKKY